MPSNLKRFTRELKEKNALVRKLAEATYQSQAGIRTFISKEFPITLRVYVYEYLPISMLVNKVSKLSTCDRSILLKSDLLKSIKKNCYTLIVKKDTNRRALNKLKFQFLLADTIKMIIKYMYKSVMQFVFWLEKPVLVAFDLDDSGHFCSLENNRYFYKFNEQIVSVGFFINQVIPPTLARKQLENLSKWFCQQKNFIIYSIDNNVIVGSFVKNLNILQMNLKLKSLKNVNELLLNYQHLQILHFSDIQAFGGITKDGKQYKMQHDLRLLRLDWMTEIKEVSFTSCTFQENFDITHLVYPKTHKLKKLVFKLTGEYSISQIVPQKLPYLKVLDYSVYVDILNVNEMDLNPDEEFKKACKRLQRQLGTRAADFENPEDLHINDLETIDKINQDHNNIDLTEEEPQIYKKVKTDDGFLVFKADPGFKSESYIQKNGVRPDEVDINIPKMQGTNLYPLYRRILESASEQKSMIPGIVKTKKVNNDLFDREQFIKKEKIITQRERANNEAAESLKTGKFKPQHILQAKSQYKCIKFQTIKEVGEKGTIKIYFKNLNFGVLDIKLKQN